MDGHHLSLGIERLIPSGDSVERRVIAEFERQALERGNMRPALSRTVEIIFIFDLHADDRPAILPEQPAHLIVEAAPEAFDQAHIGRVVGARVPAPADPVGDTAKARLGMAPRAGAQEEEQAMVLALQFQKELNNILTSLDLLFLIWGLKFFLRR
mgnify:CR=1 FL=1